MKWKDLIAEVEAVGASGDSDRDITGIEYDSRRVRLGSVFVAMKGATTDGNRICVDGLRAQASYSAGVPISGLSAWWLVMS